MKKFIKWYIRKLVREVLAEQQFSAEKVRFRCNSDFRDRSGILAQEIDKVWEDARAWSLGRTDY